MLGIKYMRRIGILTSIAVVLYFVLSSIYSIELSNLPNASNEFTPEVEPSSISSYERLFVADDYILTDNMLKVSKKLKDGKKTIYCNIAWFSNKELNQVLAIELGTDNFQHIIYHFKKSGLNTEIIQALNMFESLDDKNYAMIEDIDRKKQYIEEYIVLSMEIEKEYFVTKKGITLGDSKRDIEKYYGLPNSVSSSGLLKRYEWRFIGQESQQDEYMLEVDIIAENSFGHEATMFFNERNRLESLMLFNPIP